MRIMDSKLLTSKVRGSFLGVLLGDCLGLPFENEIFEKGAKLTLKQYFDKLEGPLFKVPYKKYSDDTTMSKSIAQTLIRKKCIDQKELAINFVREFYKEPHRGYGAGVVEVFQKLRNSNFENCLLPAAEQFNGTGSFGNGGAMRVAPVALFCHSKTITDVIDMARKSAEVTHTNRLGVNGAILQAIAVHQSLLMDPKDGFDQDLFIKNLITKMEDVEKGTDETLGLENKTPYINQLNLILYFLANPERAHDTAVIERLGNSVAALHSVPTAIYSFILAQKEIKDIHTNNPFRRTLEYSISLGGDTDTIAAMSGSICGAYHGNDIISQNLIKHCEKWEEIISLSDDLIKASLD